MVYSTFQPFNCLHYAISYVWIEKLTGEAIIYSDYIILLSILVVKFFFEKSNYNFFIFFFRLVTVLYIFYFEKLCSHELSKWTFFLCKRYVLFVLRLMISDKSSSFIWINRTEMIWLLLKMKSFLEVEFSMWEGGNFSDFFSLWNEIWHSRFCWRGNYCNLYNDKIILTNYEINTSPLCLCIKYN